MRFTLAPACALLAVCALAQPPLAAAQVTTGTIAGRITDTLGAPIPFVSVEASNQLTGLIRTDATDAAGVYRLQALPAGPYRVRINHANFAPFDRVDVRVSAATATTLDVVLVPAAIVERVAVSAAEPLIPTRDSSIGEVVDVNRIRSLPLNGRQFANLAAVVPGVGLGFHSDVSKSTQYAPQISGGNGRNINYVVDGGDNNDDTVGGLLQMYPLEAIAELKVVTQRFDAEYGRSNGAVLNVTTRSGTNAFTGSWFTLARDEALNARTFTERLTASPRQAYSRYQFGGSAGGPIRRDRIHFFTAYEATRQDARQAVSTRVFAGDGVFDVPMREQMVTGKISAALSPDHDLAVRYARNHNRQPNGVSPTAARSAWATSTSVFDSLNAIDNRVTGPSSLNAFVFQVSRFVNDIPLEQPGPSIVFGTATFGGSNVSAPQRTEQVKWQFRDDYAWSTAGPGLAHDFRAGVNVVKEPRLFVSTEQGKYGIYMLGTDRVDGPVVAVLQTGGTVAFNLPLTTYGLYVQDDWRVTDRLTMNLGVRWDYVRGLPIDQSRSVNFERLQAAGRAGQLSALPLLDDFGHEPRNDRDNVQPRIGAAYDLRGDGRDVLRGGWGIYTDFAYTGSNVILAALDALGGGGIVFQASDPDGLRKADGSLFTVDDPIATIEHLNQADRAHPVAGEVASPLLEQPYTRQASIGWQHALGRRTALSVDYVRVDGRDLNMRVRPNVVVDGRPLLANVGIEPPTSQFRVAVSKGRSTYKALITGLRRRMTDHVDVNAAYTLARATSSVGTAYDEVAQNILQNVFDPFNAVQDAPSSRTDARHQISASAIIEAPYGLQIAPVFFYRSALPMHTFDQLDPNGDENRNDITAVAYRYAGLSRDGTARIEEDGPCRVVNCSRRAPFSQLNLRVSRAFHVGGRLRVEAIGELFNLFNATNPFIPASSARTTARGVPLATFMRPTAFAGDTGQSEQRIGQIGFRLTF